MAGAEPDRRRARGPTEARRHGRAAHHLVAAGAAMDCVADLPGSGGVQLAERLLLGKRVARAHRGDRHQHLVYGQTAGRTEVRAEGADPPARRVQLPNQLGAGAFRGDSDARRGSGVNGHHLRRLHRSCDGRRRLHGHRNLHRGLDRQPHRPDLRRRTRKDARLRTVRARDPWVAAAVVQPHPILQPRQRIPGPPRRIGLRPQR